MQRAIYVHHRYAIDSTEAVGEHVFGQAGNLGVCLSLRGQRDLHDGLRRRIDVEQNRLAHLHGQLVAHRSDGVADFIRGLRHVLLEVEDDDDPRLALRGGRAELVDLRNALQGLLDPIDDFALDGLR